MGLFVYVGATFLMNAVVTGTSTSETIVTTIVPVVLGVAVVGIMIRVFR